MRFRSKRYKKDASKLAPEPVALDEAISKLRSFTKAKFDQTVDLVCHLGIDPKQADQMLRGSVGLPKGIGKSKKVVAFCGDNDVEAAKAAGAIEAGGDELVKKVSDGWMDFDVAVAHPSMMGKVGKLGRVLGPQGKMPSPKSGTVTPDIITAVKEYSAGKLEYRNDAGGNIHAPVGKLSFPDEDLKENIVAFVGHIRKIKPAAAKGQYLKRVCISGTMTPSVSIKVSATGGVE
jgi:large subunit ribosomal protein L1